MESWRHGHSSEEDIPEMETVDNVQTASTRAHIFQPLVKFISQMEVADLETF